MTQTPHPAIAYDHEPEKRGGLLKPVISIVQSRPMLFMVIGYTVFFLLSLVVFMFVRFSPETIESLVQRQVSDLPVGVDVSRYALSFPPALVLEDVRIAGEHAGGAGELLMMERVKITPSLVAAFSGRRSVTYEAVGLGGVAMARVDQGSGDDGKTDVDFSFNNLDPGKGRWWSLVPWGVFYGHISGAGSFSSKPGNPLMGTGNMQASLERGRLVVKKTALLSLPDIIIDTGSIQMDYGASTLDVKKFILDGPESHIALSGAVHVGSSARYTRLDLNLSVTVSGSLKKRLGPLFILFPNVRNGSFNVHVKGTLAQPDIR